MNNKKVCKLLCEMALEYRLSLENICKLLRLEPTEENKMNFYNEVKNLFERDPYVLKKYNYLFFYETPRESEASSKIAYSIALNFMKRYNNALKNKDSIKAKEIRKELFKTDYSFKSVIQDIRDKSLSKEDMEIITRYRIKYAISKDAFSDYYGISRTTFIVHEDLIESKPLIEKNQMLTDYHIDRSYSKGTIQRINKSKKK